MLIMSISKEAAVDATVLEDASANRAPELTSEVIDETLAIYQRVRHIIPPMEWSVHAPYIAAINKLKRERKAIILAHNYQTPEIFHGVSDLTGDSLALAREATKVDADIIMLCGVHFMAETAKLLNPAKTVLIPDLEAGCSLASSITAACCVSNIRELPL
jgi:quinolinate synthase